MGLKVTRQVTSPPVPFVSLTHKTGLPGGLAGTLTPKGRDDGTVMMRRAVSWRLGALASGLH